MHKNEEQTCKTCRISIIPTKPIYHTHQNINKSIFPYLNIYTKSKKTRARNLKYIENKRNPIPFLEDWWRIDEENGGFVSDNGGFRRERGGQYKVCARNMRENWKVFENCLRFNPVYAKHAIFATQLTREQVTKMSCQNPVKILFKSFLRLEDPLVRESWNLLYKLATRASTHDQVAKMTKTQKFWKIF